MPLSAKKVFGIGSAPYTSSNKYSRGAGSATRKKVDAKKLELIRAWKKNLAGVLRVGTGLDIHLDTAMRELVEDLQKWDDTLRGKDDN